MRRLFSVVILFLALAAYVGSASAAEQPKTKSNGERQVSQQKQAAQKQQRKQRPRDYAATRLSEVDEDFPFQGEYLGSIWTSSTTWSPIGLQVVALGNGEFMAVEYSGGLPGFGWDNTHRVMLEGRRDGNVVTLTGSPFQIEIEEGVALVSHLHRGFALGTLGKHLRRSPTLGASPPPGAVVLFDGIDTGRLKDVDLTEEGLLKEGAQTADAYRNYRLHVEFRLPYMPYARGQGRANSGVYLQSRYEVQILDSFGLEGAHNECGGLYKYRRPDTNMCLPPLRWQTYDIEFHAPRFDNSGNKMQHARLTVWHNGVIIHNNVEVERKTGGGAREGPKPLPIKFQDHRNPVRVRNMWLVELPETDEPAIAGPPATAPPHSVAASAPCCRP